MLLWVVARNRASDLGVADLVALANHVSAKIDERDAGITDCHPKGGCGRGRLFRGLSLLPQRSDLDDRWRPFRVGRLKSVCESKADGSPLEAVAAREMEMGLEDDQGCGRLSFIGEMAVGYLLQLGFEYGLGGGFVGLDEETVYLIGVIVDAEFRGFEGIFQGELNG